MAKPRKLWSALKPDTKKRKLAHYAKEGLTPGQVTARYNKGTLGPQSASRGHARTPEHGLKSAKASEARYAEYIRKRTPPPSVVAADKLHQARMEAYVNINFRLGPGRPGGGYAKFNYNTVYANCFGGTTSESGNVPGLDLPTAQWTAKATEEQLIERAYPYYLGNPWWYH